LQAGLSLLQLSFSTSLRYKNELLAALLKETELQKDYLENELVETIYFGGGTPSLLQIQIYDFRLIRSGRTFYFRMMPEITLEANPDDINEEKLCAGKKLALIAEHWRAKFF
jgi:oxygen-independent coproporphyrinogen-3 oxidase